MPKKKTPEERQREAEERRTENLAEIKAKREERRIERSKVRGITPKERLEIETGRARREGRPEPTLVAKDIARPPEPLTEEQRGLVEPELVAVAEREKVFEEPVVEPIIQPEQENLSVMVRIVKSLIPKSISKAFKDIDTVGGILDFKETEPISQAEITMIAADLQEAVIAESSVEIDKRIEETEELLIQQGIPLAAIATVVGAAVVGGIVAAPIKEFVGTDGQIRSLELALSQYNEMVTIPARGIDSGLDPQVAFDKLSRMEDGILALEAQLKISALKSVKVGLALRGRGVEARLLKLKEKIQEARRIVFGKMAQEAFREVEVTESIRFLRRLQNEGKKSK